MNTPENVKLLKAHDEILSKASGKDGEVQYHGLVWTTNQPTALRRKHVVNDQIGVSMDLETFIRRTGINPEIESPFRKMEDGSNIWRNTRGIYYMDLPHCAKKRGVKFVVLGGFLSIDRLPVRSEA